MVCSQQRSLLGSCSGYGSAGFKPSLHCAQLCSRPIHLPGTIQIHRPPALEPSKAGTKSSYAFDWKQLPAGCALNIVLIQQAFQQLKFHPMGGVLRVHTFGAKYLIMRLPAESKMLSLVLVPPQYPRNQLLLRDVASLQGDKLEVSKPKQPTAAKPD